MILGLSDGAAPGAALVVDDRLVAVEAARGDERDPQLPLAAARRALAVAGLAPADVTLVALAGRYTPPLAVRRRPRLRRWAVDPFSPARAFATRAERFLRGTGLGAADADRARDWLADHLVPHGYRPRKVTLVDIHRALAASVYRSRADDRATIVVVHPDGDGVFASVHRAVAGQVDRVMADRATTGVHLFLPRALAALGAPDLPALGVLAAGADPDPALRRELGDAVAYEGRFSGRPGPERWNDPPWRQLRADPAAGAATVLAHLREILSAFVRHHQLEGPTHLAGAWFADPGPLALPVAGPLSMSPWRGDAGLAVGAATDAAGLTPALRPADLGAPVSPDGDGPELVSPQDAAAVIAAGAPWVRCRGRAAAGPGALRHRGVWVRASDARAVARARERLEVPSAAAPVFLRATPPAGLPEGLRGAWEDGVTVEGRTVVGPAGDPTVTERLRALASAGVDEVALLPLTLRGRSASVDPAAVRELATALGAALEWSDRYEPRPS